MSKIKETFEEHLEHLQVNDAFAGQVYKEQRAFVARRDENLEFLGDKLIGTPRFRFNESDRARIFDQLLEVDEFSLRKDLHRIDELDPETRKVASDVFNQTSCYLVHAFHKADMSDDKRYQGQMSILRLLHYRFLGSLMAHYFPYEADRKTAEAAYARLNYRYDLKKEGSWAALIDRRCEDILSDASIHKKTIQNYDDDEAVVRMINDIQGRIREIVKKITAVFYEVKNAQTKVKTRSATVQLDEEVHVRDLVRREAAYKRYLYGIMGDRPSLIKRDLIEIALELIHTAPEHRLRAALNYISDASGRGGDRRIQPFIEGLTNHLFRFIRNYQRELGRSMSYGELLVKLRSLYLSSKIRDSELIETRDRGVEIMKDALESKNQALLASVRSAVMIYLVLRMLAMDHYLQASPSKAA